MLLTYLLHPVPGCRTPEISLRPFFSRWLHVQPIFLASASRSCDQVFLGWPIFLFPWGFHLSICPVLLVGGLRGVCPTQHPLFFLTSSSTWIWQALSHKLMLLIVSDQQMWRIFKINVPAVAIMYTLSLWRLLSFPVSLHIKTATVYFTLNLARWRKNQTLWFFNYWFNIFTFRV